MSDKIQILLKLAEMQADSAEAAQSSAARATHSFPSASEAEKNFSRFREKLFRVGDWGEFSGISSYELFDENGGKAHRSAVAGDFIKITLSGSGKDDWVKIISIHEAPGEIILTVKPSYNPTEKDADKSVTSHFFTDDATNNFCLERKDESLNFYVIGLSEKSNASDTKNILETVRNLATANLGHYLGIQQSEWQKFCENFLEVKPKKEEK